MVQDMTPARKAALQFFHDRGEVAWFKLADNPPSETMQKRMIKDGQLETRGTFGVLRYTLTDAGRRALQEAGK